MTRTVVLIFTLSCLITPVLISNAVAAEHSTTKPSKRALLIGIDKYKSADVSDLNGAVNDVNLLREILVGKFDFAPANVVVLQNEQATRQGIINAIKTHLINKSAKGDIIVLHFSGHGSQMPDISGDEIDRLDETIVPHDSRTQGVFDISDDEINGLMRQLTDKTPHVTFIFDSCHSGAAARGGATVRQTPADTRLPPAPAAFAISAKDGQGATDLRPHQSNYVLISGSLAKELSNETMFGDRRYGAMTWHLAAALKSASARTSYRDIMDQVKDEVNSRFPSQHPQIEGPGQDLNIFGTDKIQTRPYVLVKPLSGNKVRIQAGKVFGLGDGTELKVYAPKTADFDNSTPIATLKVEHTDDFEASARVIGGGPVKPFSRALLQSFAFGNTSIPVYVASTGTPSVFQKIKHSLSKMPTITLIDKAQDARLLINEQAGYIQIQSGDLTLLVPPLAMDREDIIHAVSNQVKDIVHWMVLIDLNNPGSAIKVDFDIRRHQDPSGSPSPRVISNGTKLRYRVSNMHTQPLYIYLLNISSDGSIGLMYPRGEQQQLPAGETLQRTLRMSVPPHKNSVLDVLKVVATLQPIDPTVFPRGPVRSAAKASTRATSDPLSRFLASATRGGRMAEDIDVPADNWVTVQKTVRIKRSGVKLNAFTLHFDQQKTKKDIINTLVKKRALCPSGNKGEATDCEQLNQITKDKTAFEIIPTSTTRSADGKVSVGKSFDEAYAIQDQTGAKRVEPMFEIPTPGLETEQGIDKRDVPGDKKHDPAAEKDDRWNLKQIRAFDAWEKIRDRYDLENGEEAQGIYIAHPDTGFRHHPETWTETDGRRPVDHSKGKNYYEGGNDAFDPLLSDRLLDNPGHGTASGSVIVSPNDCQLDNAAGCVYGVGRGARLIPLRVHRTVSQINTRNLSQAIQDVADGKVPGNPRLISIAMGGLPTYTMWKAVRAAEKKGIIIIAAAGNYVRFVVWPARFRSTIAVAAGNIRCKPWKNSSRGHAVDIMAPGESVWRATLNKAHKHINGMGKGTTFATGNVAGAAALWLSAHRDEPLLNTLADKGYLTESFRNALHNSAWQPSADGQGNPADTLCEPSSWDDRFGKGLLDIAKLIDQPLIEYDTVEHLDADEPDLPLFESLYPNDTDEASIHEDYRSLFKASRSTNLKDIRRFETEILYHYHVNESVQTALDQGPLEQRSIKDTQGLRNALLTLDLSQRLREALKP